LLIQASKRLTVEGHTILVVSQTKFSKTGSEKINENDTIWNIPITVCVKSTYPYIHRQIMMNSKSIEIDLGVLESDEWIKVNKDNIGFYLTFYSSEMFENLLLNLSDPNNYASPLDRFGVVNEAFFAVRLIE
jgi:hypothetical protein